ncbi:MAG: thioredoxin fold domain-containing protein [Bacteroidota bacterium]
MRVLLTVLCAGVLLASHTLAQQPADTLPAPAWVSVEAALAEAKEREAKTMVFVYTEWCGYCRKTTRDVHSNDEVLDILNTHFAVTRLDAESEAPVTFKGIEATEAELAQALGASGFPTTVFLDAEGNYISKLPGYLPADQFQTILAYIAEDAFKEQSYEEFVAGR